MRTWSVLVSLLALLTVDGAYAGTGSVAGPVSRGNFLRIPSYKTTGSLSLFVNGSTGSDTNDCASASTPCATLQGAANLIPKLVRHPVTVTVASGNYAGLYLYGFEFDPASVTNGAYINWTGTLANYSPATGTATGTATAGSAGSGATFGTLTDSGQSWTTNDLKGKLLRITGGTGSGQVRIIASNTGTVITIAGAFATAPVGASSTYAISDWASVITTAVNSPALPGTAAGTPLALRMEGNSSVRMSGSPSTTQASGAAITFTDMAFVPGTATNGAVRLNGPNQVAFTECKIAGNTTGVGLSILGGSYVALDKTWITSGTGTALGANFTNGPSTYLQAGFSLVESSATAALTPVITPPSAGSFTNMQINALGSGASAGIATVGGGTLYTIANTNIVCTGGSSVGISLGGLTTSQTGGPVAPGQVQMTGGVTITSCDTGLLVGGGGIWSSNTTSFTLTGTGAQTAGLKATYGGKIVGLGGSPASISGYTNEVNVDGTTSTIASINSAVPPVLFSLNYGSYVGQ